MNILLERILIDYSLRKFIFVVYNFWIYLQIYPFILRSLYFFIRICREYAEYH